jgi:hypothetical protein
MFHIFTQVCFGLVLSLFWHFGVTLPLPPPEVLVGDLRTHLMEFLDVLVDNTIPALSFALVIRKLTS